MRPWLGSELKPPFVLHSCIEIPCETAGEWRTVIMLFRDALADVPIPQHT